MKKCINKLNLVYGDDYYAVKKKNWINSSRANNTVWCINNRRNIRYGNEKNKSNIQLEEYEIKDLANLIGKNKIDVENVLGKGYEKEILQQESNVYIGFDEKREVASLINISFVEDDESTYRIISERLWNELGKSSLKFVSSDNKVIETWNKGDLEINFNKIKDCISIKIN